MVQVVATVTAKLSAVATGNAHGAFGGKLITAPPPDAAIGRSTTSFTTATAPMAAGNDPANSRATVNVAPSFEAMMFVTYMRVPAAGAAINVAAVACATLPDARTGLPICPIVAGVVPVVEPIVYAGVGYNAPMLFDDPGNPALKNTAPVPADVTIRTVTESAAV